MAAAVALDQETNGGVRKFEVCDNIDLEMMLMEYESYHFVKFQKYPKLIRRTAEPGILPPLKHRATYSEGYIGCCSILNYLDVLIHSQHIIGHYFLLYFFFFCLFVLVKVKTDMQKVVE